MKYRDFAGKRASNIVIGCDSFGLTRDPAAAAEFLDAYLGAGGNFLDTARVYGGEFGTSEKYIGKWLSGQIDRESLIIGTKGGHPFFSSMHEGRLGRDALTYDLECSLENLQCGYIDIYWLHRDDTSREVGEMIETLNSFIDRGFIRYLGASNWSAKRLEEANEYAKKHGLQGFIADQPQFSLARQSYIPDDTMVQMDRGLYGFHKRSGMPCIPYSPQAKGFFQKLEKGGVENLPGILKSWFLCPENLRIFERLKTLSGETGLPIAALCLGWLNSHPFDVYPIIGASSIGMLLDTLKYADLTLLADRAEYLRKI